MIPDTPLTLVGYRAGGATVHLRSRGVGFGRIPLAQQIELMNSLGWDLTGESRGAAIYRRRERMETWSPEANQIHQRVMAAWEKHTPAHARRQASRAWQELGGLFFARYHHELMPCREDIEAGITVGQVVSRVVQGLRALDCPQACLREWRSVIADVECVS